MVLPEFSKKTLIAGLLLTILALFSLFSVYYFYQNKRADQKIPEPEKISNKQIALMQSRKTFIDTNGRHTKLGLKSPSTEDGHQTASIYGQMMDFVVENNEYKMVVAIPDIAGYVTINLGSEKNKLVYLYSDYNEKQANEILLRDGEIEESYRFSEVTKSITARQAYDIFKDDKGAYFRLDLNLGLPPLAQGRACNETCEANLELFERYKNVNAKFLREKNGSTEIGSVSLVSRSK